MKPEPELRTEAAERPPRPPEGAAGILLVVAGLVIAGVVAAWIWRSQAPQPHGSPVATPEPAAPAAPSSAPVAAASAPAVKHPLQDAVDQPLRNEDIPSALADLLGAKAVTSFLQTDGFPRRLVATIDSLGREHSPVAAWPVLPTGGRFTVEERADGPVISADNAARYTPFVLLAGTLDVGRAAAMYRRLYPLLQQSWRELGMGDRYLNDRVIEVIDLLLATPEPVEPPRLQLTQVKGPIPSTRPWVRYEFVDPELESLTAGQKILVRVGPVNERRLKAKLVELREQIASGGTPAATAAPAPAPLPASAPASAPASTPAPAR
ncbi:DUF3014 domain-containing protein [Ramlibacter alkalitolerans]|uniref:DUF3014 domain-containing protein n=1 Tax=Ramlibacter alkalitolerans TaxID=2039631 RepID=A0ABS1JRN7_9BURK|nr:DUF3014 domain-containing protein [Ramlibacter alkalitolerans]MBL0426240.1 DUF3014 domain-containing protein [Ramlibacter alkalitolerans]